MPATAELLRPAVEAALEVARAGARASPPVPAPQALRGVLHFKKFPAAALDFALRALDEDEEFRARVSDAVTEAQVGPAGWLYLTRPDGWREAVEELAEAEARREQAVEEERGAQRAERRLDAVEARLQSAEQRAREAVEDAEAARRDLNAERQARRQVQEELDGLRAAASAAADAQAAAEAERDAARAEAGEAREARAAAAQRAAAAEAALASRPVAEPIDPGPDPKLVEKAGQAAADAEQLADDLRFLADEFVAGARRLPKKGSRGAGPAPAPSPNGPAPARPKARRQAPATLPPGVADGTREAAAHLLRTPGMIVLVDGYNVTKRVWADAPIAEQRRRLVALLEELSARTGVRPTAVFDGDDVDDMGRREGTRGVRVEFSPAGVSADAMLISAVASSMPQGPVVVVSSDNEVRRGAAARGARVLHSEDFFAVART